MGLADKRHLGMLCLMRTPISDVPAPEPVRGNLASKKYCCKCGAIADFPWREVVVSERTDVVCGKSEIIC